MKKRMISILLCLVLLLGLLPARHVHASDDWEYGDECEFCGSYIWGDWICDCGEGGVHCGPDSDHFDCYEAQHCYECELLLPEGYVCPECGTGSCCLTEDDICVECGLCINCVDGGQLCYSCGKCALCTENFEICTFCGLCYDEGCGGICSVGTEHVCLLDHDGYVCPDCDQCLLEDVAYCQKCMRCEDCVEKCAAWDGTDHNWCLECHADFDYCPDCKHCWAADIVAGDDSTHYGCPDCTRCANCVDALCTSCGRCSDCNEICERCGQKCLDCHDDSGNACPSCYMCYKGTGHCYECGYCWECAERCDYCWKCTACRYDIHCGECGECGYKVDLCDGCGLCPDCTVYCDTCGLCVECYPENHCPDCHEHFDADELCPDCERCDSCANLCEGCGYCEDCADKTAHCSECGACAELKTLCESCGMCDECAKGANQHCDNFGCNNCFEDYYYCPICDQCVECIGEDDYCFDCYQCKSHHVGGKCDGMSSHTHRLGDWKMNASHHWKECRLCGEEQDKAVHVFNSAKKCTVCGYDSTELITFTRQPNDVRAKVSDVDAGPDDPLCFNNNTVSFRVAAIAVGDSRATLSYQWYYTFQSLVETHPERKYEHPLTDVDYTEDNGGVIKGSQTPKLTTYVSSEACIAGLVYFCRVTLTSSSGKVLAAVDSEMAELKGQHAYTYCAPVDSTYDYTLYIPTGNGLQYTTKKVRKDSGHLYYCCGEGDTDRVDPSNTTPMEHVYGTPNLIWASLDYPTTYATTKWYEYTCLECGAKRYVEKHEHEYELEVDNGRPETLRFLEENCTAFTHPVRCTVSGCSAVSHEVHSYVPKIYSAPKENDNGTFSLGQYTLECYQCEYPLSGRALYEANGNTSWDTLRTLVSARNAGVQILDSFDNFATLCIAMSGDTILLTPQATDGKKVVSWTADYTDYSTGSAVKVDITVPCYRNSDGTWWCVMPNIYRVTGGKYPSGCGALHFTPKYATCEHENGTKLVDYVEPVCMYDGYSGDGVCVDCGARIGVVGEIIPANSTEHTGEWVLLTDTVKEATCTQKGYTGDYQCSACGDIQTGNTIGYHHGNTELRNAVEATCVTVGYTGDTYCLDCGKLVQSGRTLSLDENNHKHKVTVAYRRPTCTRSGSTGYTICRDCDKTLSRPSRIPALGHAWDAGEITEAPTETETGTILFRCTRTNCNGTKTEVLPNTSSSPISSVALKVSYPSEGTKAAAVTASAASYTVVNTSWLDDLTGNDIPIGSTFASGTTYTVKVELEVTGNNVFTYATAFTVNGSAATVVYRSLETVTLTYIFDCPSEAFADLDTSRWYHEGIDFVLNNGYMAGTDKGFQPDAPLTREMLAQILYAKAGKPAIMITGRFPDEDKTRWYASAIEWAAANGYIAGYGNGNFGVGDAVTREQIAVILYAYEGKPDVGETSLDSYPDAGQVSGWAKTAMVWAVENKLITGNAKGELMPKNAATRATFAVIFYAYLS